MYRQINTGISCGSSTSEMINDLKIQQTAFFKIFIDNKKKITASLLNSSSLSKSNMAAGLG